MALRSCLVGHNDSRLLPPTSSSRPTCDTLNLIFAVQEAAHAITKPEKFHPCLEDQNAVCVFFKALIKSRHTRLTSKCHAHNTSSSNTRTHTITGHSAITGSLQSSARGATLSHTHAHTLICSHKEAPISLNITKPQQTLKGKQFTEKSVLFCNKRRGWKKSKKVVASGR